MINDLNKSNSLSLNRVEKIKEILWSYYKLIFSFLDLKCEFSNDYNSRASAIVCTYLSWNFWKIFNHGWILECHLPYSFEYFQLSNQKQIEKHIAHQKSNTIIWNILLIKQTDVVFFLLTRKSLIIILLVGFAFTYKNVCLSKIIY